MELLDVFKTSDVYKILDKDQKNNMVNHSYLFFCDDEELLNNYAKFVSMKLLCKNNICGECSNCLKIKNNTHTDVLVYPKDKDKSILTNDILEIIRESYISKIEDYKIFILKNFEKTPVQAQNKFLKTLEEPPKNVIFILLTTDDKAILKTIVSRCKFINIKNLNIEELQSVVSKINNTQLQTGELARISRNLTTAYKIINSPYYISLKNDVISVFTSLKHSKNMLNYVYKLSNYKNVLEVLNEMNSVVLDLALLKNNNKQISNINYLTELLNASKDYSIVALNKIALKIKQSIEKVNSYCNTNIVLDNLLIYILEVKVKC